MNHSVIENANARLQERLCWVQRNIRASHRAQRLGALVDQWARRWLGPENPRESAARRAVEAIADPQFVAHCRFESLRAGTVTVTVDRPELVAAMRLRWHMEIRDLLSHSAARCDARNIVFHYVSHSNT